MSRRLQNKVFIVTGASSGIGAATAVEAARHGMRLVLAARRADKLEEIAMKVRAAGGEALTVPTDVADRKQVESLIAAARGRYGRVDAIFVNAGFGFFQETVTEDRAEMERVMWNVNYFSAVHGVRAAAEAMKSQGGGGHILICSSVAGFTGLPYKGSYSATKAALHGFAASLRIELRGSGIEITTVYPAATESEFSETSRRLSTAESPQYKTPRSLVQSSEHVAKRVVQSLLRPRPEVWPSRTAHLMAAVWTLFPRFRDWCFAKGTKP